MNEYRSHREATAPVLERAARAAVARAMHVFPVVALIGARQTGKSALVRTMPELAGRTYLTLDEPELRDQARRDPASVLVRGHSLVLDEVQRAPDVLLAIKQAVDADRPRVHGRYVLTGSANLLLMLSGAGPGDAVRGALLLHAGEETFRLAEDVLATPWWRVL